MAYPEMPPVDGRQPTHEEIFGQNSDWRAHGLFVSALLGVRFIEPRPFLGMFMAQLDPSPAAQYSIVSLNYDLVVEKAAGFLARHHQVEAGAGLDVFPGCPARTGSNKLPLAKLHGTLNSTIVPPTWSKGRHPDIRVAWQEAHRALTKANYVRFIGYSLPLADANFRYLMKSAVIQSPNLKGIDVICRDDDARTVEARYREFIPEFSGFRFINVKTERYGLLARAPPARPPPAAIPLRPSADS